MAAEMSSESGSASRTLATWLSETDIARIPDEVLMVARRAAVDTVGVMLAGVEEPVVEHVRHVLARSACSPVATQVGTAFRTSAEDAALLNGTAAHALDFDDVAVAASAHASAVVLPAAFAAAEQVGASGASTLASFAIGLETVARLGRAMGEEHYARGWHSTSTLGAVGAAAAAASILELDPGQTLCALGIAASSASGLRQNFGTMTKPFHAGQASRGGVLAARLAERGFTAADDALDGDHGFFALFAFGGGRPKRMVDDLGISWELTTSGIATKRYPCCFALHRALDGVIALRTEHAIAPEDVERVEVAVPVGGLAPLLDDAAVEDGTTAKFSMGFALGAALIDGGVKLETFADSIACRPDLLRLSERVAAREDPAIQCDGDPFDGGWVEVRIVLADGRVAEMRVGAAVGSPARPLGAADLDSKFRDCASRRLDAGTVEAALEALHSLDRHRNIGDLMTILGPVSS